MPKWLNLEVLLRFARDDSGATAIEYGVLIGMIFVILIGIASLGGQVGVLFKSISAKLAAAMGF